MTKMLTAERLRELFAYDPATGQFTRLVKGGKRKVGSVHSAGYVQMRVNREDHLAHRLAWLYMTGEWPADEIDHKNRVRSDNRWLNLRCADRSANSQNTAIRTDNAAGIRGVYWCEQRQKWCADIQAAGRRHRLGRFDTQEAAAAAYAAAAERLHPARIARIDP